jgi:8-oxo-dGTP pyrophosphatase MutT (NUDIX family)
MGKIEESSGIAIVCDDKLLLCHSTNSRWFGTYMPPKGHIEKGESEVEAACRETYEEVGIKILPHQLGKKHIIHYTRGKKVFKTVYIFECYINSLEEIGLKNEILPQSMLQLNEINDAKFMDYEEASVRILPRYKDLLDSVIKK